MYCDLHTHSIFSDGTMSPTEIIKEAKAAGLTVALTDHNTTGGLPEFMEAARQQGVTALAGTELSTEYKSKELHLLGLFIAPEKYAAVERLVKEVHVLKEISNMEMAERLNNAGYEIDYISVKNRNPSGNANRAHFAAELFEHGYVSSVAEAFRTLLSEDGEFYVPPERLQLIDAIKFLRSINAVPVLAHPLQELDEDELRELLPCAIEAGLMGIETYHSSFSDDDIRLAKSIADEFGLIKSGGSDFHGTTKPGIMLGKGRGNLAIPDEIYFDLKEAAEKL